MGRWWGVYWMGRWWWGLGDGAHLQAPLREEKVCRSRETKDDDRRLFKSKRKYFLTYGRNGVATYGKKGVLGFLLPSGRCGIRVSTADQRAIAAGASAAGGGGG